MYSDRQSSKQQKANAREILNGFVVLLGTEESKYACDTPA